MSALIFFWYEKIHGLSSFDAWPSTRQHLNMNDSTKQDYAKKIYEAVKEDLRSRSEAYEAIEHMEVDYPDVEVEPMEFEYPDMGKQVDELCLQFEKLHL